MAIVEIRVPDIGDFKNIPVIEVHIAPGQAIAAEDPLVTLESDKATMEVPSPRRGDDCRGAALGWRPGVRGNSGCPV